MQLKGKPISSFFVSEVLKETEGNGNFSLGLVEHALSTNSEFIKLLNGFYDLTENSNEYK